MRSIRASDRQVKIALLYLRVVKRADPSMPMPFNYRAGARRWLESYRQFKPALKHQVVIANCGSHTEFDEEFDEVANSYAYYDGLGTDCGTFQAIGRTMDCDLVVCFNSIAYLHRENWLEPIVAGFKAFGPGVYGPTASYERNPHLRTPCIAFSPDVMRQYPYECRTRADAIAFESGGENFSLWAYHAGFPSILVTADGEYWGIDKWRQPPNIFRRGDQSNCLVWDRHTDLYANASDADKENLAKLADTLTAKF